MNWKTIGFQSLARWLTSSKNISVALKNKMEYVDTISLSANIFQKYWWIQYEEYIRTKNNNTKV